MGYMRHHAIVVTSHDSNLLAIAQAKAIETLLADAVSSITLPIMNGYQSFLVAPDGSKEGWNLSDEFEKRREEFVAWLKKQAYSDGSTSLQWVLVQFGDDMQEARVLDSCDDYSTGAQRREKGGTR